MESTPENKSNNDQMKVVDCINEDIQQSICSIFETDKKLRQ